MPDPGVLVPRQFYSDLLKMHSEWRRKPKNAPIQRGRWPAGSASGATWIGVLQGSLAYGSSATVMLYKWDDGSSAFIEDKTDTVYPWMMNTGDSVPTNTKIVGGTVGGKRVIFNAACKNIYGS